jgi:hypothetical protein
VRDRRQDIAPSTSNGYGAGFAIAVTMLCERSEGLAACVPNRKLHFASCKLLVFWPSKFIHLLAHLWVLHAEVPTHLSGTPLA